MTRSCAHSICYNVSNYTSGESKTRETHVELSAVLSVRIVQRDDLEAEQVVSIFDALGDSHALDAAVRDLSNGQEGHEGRRRPSSVWLAYQLVDCPLVYLCQRYSQWSGREKVLTAGYQALCSYFEPAASCTLRLSSARGVRHFLHVREHRALLCQFHSLSIHRRHSLCARKR